MNKSRLNQILSILTGVFTHKFWSFRVIPLKDPITDDQGVRSWSCRDEVDAMSVKEFVESTVESTKADISFELRLSFEKSYLSEAVSSHAFQDNEREIVTAAIDKSYPEINHEDDLYWWKMYEVTKKPIEAVTFLSNKFSDNPDDYNYKYLDGLLGRLTVESNLRLAFHFIYENSTPGLSEINSYKRKEIAFSCLSKTFELYPEILSKDPNLNVIFGLSKSILEFEFSDKSPSSSQKNYRANFRNDNWFIDDDDWFDSFVSQKSYCSIIVWQCKNNEHLRNALNKPRWEYELEKYAQWDKDMDEAEDLTDQEAEAYKRVMERLGA